MLNIRTLVLAATVGETVGANPIRKVVNMLQNMVSKIEAEGETQEQLFQKFMCYCKNGKGSLQKSIADAEGKLPKLSSTIKQIEAELQGVQAEIDQAKSDRSEAQAALQKANEVRAKEADIFAKTSSDFETNIAAIGKAISVLEAGAGGGSFLQNSVVPLLKKISMGLEMQSSDRETLSAFLSTGSDHGYAPQSGEITGILKQMKERMEADFTETRGAEAEAIEQFNGLVAAKKKQIQGLGSEIEKKTLRIGDSGVELAELKGDLQDTENQLRDDRLFLEELNNGCVTKANEWDDTCKVRSDEILALHETIKILNDDDALELFKKTLPSASLLQMKIAHKEELNQAVHFLETPHDVRTDLIALALKGKKSSWDKVVKMIDEMVKLLGKEQSDDKAKKMLCEKQLEDTQLDIKGLESHTSDMAKLIEEAKELLNTLVSEITTTTAGIAQLDKQIAAAKEQRKTENANFIATKAENTATIELLGVAKNRMNKFYNPSLYNVAPKRELLESDRVAVNLGLGTPPPTVMGGIANTGVTVLAQADPGPAPRTGTYVKKTQESSGVIALIDRLVEDLKLEMVEDETEEKNSQESYEKLSEDASVKRASDVESVNDKKAAKADAEANLIAYRGEKVSAEKTVKQKNEILGELHQSCDWLLQYFDTRAAARQSEVESLKNAKAVLAGADYSFLQLQRKKGPEDKLAAEMTHDLEMNFNKIAPFGKEDTAKELQDHASKTQNTLVDAVENAEVAEIKRAVFRALTRLRAATIKEFDTIARLETQAIDAYNDAHHYRAENPLAHLHEDEAPVETDKLKSFH